MAILNYTTSISVEKTIGEIQGCLQRHGANAILTEYDDQGYIVALSFKIRLPEGEMGFRLPTDWRAVLEVMKHQGKVKGAKRLRYGKKALDIEKENQAQAMRVAWRITKDWVEAQMAIVEVKMVTMPQVFLPYAVTNDGKTVYERFLSGDSGMKLLNK